MSTSVSTAARIIFGLVLLAGLAVVTQAPSYAQVRLDVPYVPTPQDVVDRMLDMAKLTKDDFHMDLGSGDGRIAVTAAKRGAPLHRRRPQSDPHRGSQRERAEGRRHRPRHVRARQPVRAGHQQGQCADDVSAAGRQPAAPAEDPVGPAARLAYRLARLQHERLGADQHVNQNGRNLYLWIVPGKAEGTWQAESGGRKFAVTVKQAFQKLTGTATVDGKSIPVTGRLTGNGIELSMDLGGGAMQLRGEIKGNAIEGANLRATRS